MIIKSTSLALLLFIISSFPAYSVSLSFITRGFQHCTGYCESNKINCRKKVNKQGFYDWCKSKCLHKGKKDLSVFEAAIAKCDNKNFLVPPKERVVEPKAVPLVTAPTKNTQIDAAVLPTQSLTEQDLTKELTDAFALLGIPVTATFKEVNDRFGALDRQLYLARDQRKRNDVKNAYQIIEAAFNTKFSSSL